MLNVIISTPGGTDILTVASTPHLPCVIVNFFFDLLFFIGGGATQSTLKGVDGHLLPADIVGSGVVGVFIDVGIVAHKSDCMLLNHVVGSGLGTNSVLYSSSSPELSSLEVTVLYSLLFSCRVYVHLP